MRDIVSDPLSFLALGDSYTIGEGVPEHLRWPAQVVEAIRVKDSVMPRVDIVAKTGWTTGELLAGMAAASLDAAYDVVSLLAGVNDQYRGLPVEVYAREFEELLLEAVRLARGEAARVVVLSIPDWGVTPFAEGRNRDDIARDIDAFNRVNRDLAVWQGAHYVDVTGISRACAGWPDGHASDGLHPSGRQYAAWADVVVPVAASILRT